MEQISSLLAAAAVGGFAITAVAGKFMIPALHRLHFGQTIREEGPTWHNKKNGTPTMGGLCFILGIVATLGIVWAIFHASFMSSTTSISFGEKWYFSIMSSRGKGLGLRSSSG